MTKDAWGLETRLVHAGAEPDPATGARVTPIYQTTSFVFRDAAHAAALFGLEELGMIYTRIMNPTQDAFEQRMTALEGGVGALATGSGQAAQTIALLNLAENGGHIVSSASLYGGTYNQLHYTFPKLGVEVTFIDDPDDLDAWKKAIKPNTKAFYGESIGNPKGDIFDFEGISKIAHDNNIPLVIDNTLASPALLQPMRYGTDVVVHSATKFIGGHGTSIGGVIVDSGAFDYPGSGRFPGFTEPDPSYHGLVFDQLPPELRPAMFVLKCRLQWQRDIGAAISPFNAFLFLQGLQTLSLRMERHSQNALTVAKWLEGRDEVAWVAYPGLASSPWHERAKKYLPNGQGAIIAFELKGGVEAGKNFIDSLELFSHLANVGDVRSLAIHPATTTHSQLELSEQAATGVTPGLVRLSVGIETIDDILADLEAGLRARRQVLVADDLVTEPETIPVSGAWRPGDPPGRRQFVTIFGEHPLSLRAGGTLSPVTVAYETWGSLSPARDNALLLCHALTGDTHATGPVEPGHPQLGWWNPLIGPGRAIDTDRWFVVCPNVLGGCQGTTGPASVDAATGKPYGSRFPVTTIRDQVDVEAALTDALGIERWAAVIGGSMGGQRALEWAVKYPACVGRAVIIACGAAATAEQIALCSLQIRAIETDPHFHGGDYYDLVEGPWRGMSLARGIGQVSYRSELELQQRFNRGHQNDEHPFEGGQYTIESYLEYHGEKLAHRFDANSYIGLSRAMNHHDLGRGRGGVAHALSRVTAEVTIAGISTDRLYPLRLQHELADLVPRNKGVEVVHSNSGHDGFLTEHEAIGEIIAGALA